MSTEGSTAPSPHARPEGTSGEADARDAGARPQGPAQADDQVGVDRPQPWVYTVTDLAAALRIGRNNAYALVREGQIAHVRVGRSIRIPRHALEAFLAAEVAR